GHRQNVNGLAFSADSQTLVTAGYDATVRIWPLTRAEPPRIITLPAPLHAVIVGNAGGLFAPPAHRKLYFLSPARDLAPHPPVAAAPLIALSGARDARHIAASSIKGAIAIIDHDSRRLERTLVGPGLPAWAVIFLADNRSLLTGGSDRVIRRWNSESGEQLGEVALAAAEDPLAGFTAQPGAGGVRACLARHTLSARDGPRAGPTLAGIFGRRIASLPGYDFSPALKKLDIVWTPETLSKLFELGPAAYTPGSKMPEQRVGEEARADLIAFLSKATKD